MKKYRGSEDTYRELVEESDQNWLLGLVAFAVIGEGGQVHFTFRHAGMFCALDPRHLQRPAMKPYLAPFPALARL